MKTTLKDYNAIRRPLRRAKSTTKAKISKLEQLESKASPSHCCHIEIMVVPEITMMMQARSILIMWLLSQCDKVSAFFVDIIVRSRHAVQCHDREHYVLALPVT